MNDEIVTDGEIARMCSVCTCDSSIAHVLGIRKDRVAVVRAGALDPRPSRPPRGRNKITLEEAPINLEADRKAAENVGRASDTLSARLNAEFEKAVEDSGLSFDQCRLLLNNGACPVTWARALAA